MARDFNENRNVNAKLVSADIDTLGVTFAAQSPYRADGFLKVNVTVANANPTQKMFLEGADFTIYAIGGNVTKLSAYSLSMFKELEQVWLFSSTMVEIEETDNNAYLDYLKPSCVIYVPSNLISNYQTAYSNLSSKFAPINEDYTLTIVGSGTLICKLLHLFEVSILDVVALLTALLACISTGLRTCLTTCLSVHLCAGCLEGGVELVHCCVNGCEVL